MLIRNLQGTFSFYDYGVCEKIQECAVEVDCGSGSFILTVSDEGNSRNQSGKSVIRYANLERMGAHGFFSQRIRLEMLPAASLHSDNMSLS